MDAVRMMDLLADGDLIDFGDVPERVNALLQRGVALYYDDRCAADACFRDALAEAPECLPVYFCLYKIHTYQRNLASAEAACRYGLAEAARQAGVTADLSMLAPEDADWIDDGAARFMLYTMKALAFVRLRQNRPTEAGALLDILFRLDPEDAVGASVVAALADRLNDAA